jgi:hypothetical protein
MLQGRDGVGAAPCCGTGVVFRRDVLVSIGGQAYGSITEVSGMQDAQSGVKPQVALLTSNLFGSLRATVVLAAPIQKCRPSYQEQCNSHNSIPQWGLAFVERPHNVATTFLRGSGRRCFDITIWMSAGL